MSSQATSGWEIASAIATMGATIVALGLGFYQWFKDKHRQHDVRAALSRALQTDLATWRQIVHESRQKFDSKQLSHERHYVDWVKGLSIPTMPTHERFAQMLPDLGPPLSTLVVHAYAECLRVAEIITREMNRTGRLDRDFVQIASDIRPQLDAMSAHLTIAIEALGPFAAKD